MWGSAMRCRFHEKPAPNSRLLKHIHFHLRAINSPRWTYDLSADGFVFSDHARKRERLTLEAYEHCQ
jgi:hypothetical protein